MTMTVVGALLLGGVGSGGAGAPTSSFYITQDGPSAIVIAHDEGDSIEGENLYVISASGKSLGNFAGTDGQACDTKISTVNTGTECRVSGLSNSRISIVYRSADYSEVVYENVAPNELGSSGTGNKSPNAAISETKTGPGTFELDGGPSSDPDGSISSYEWDLDGDGVYDDASGATVSGVTGSKTVELQVTDDDGATDTKSRILPNDPPDAQFSYTKTGTSTYEVDASTSSDVDGSITSYEWDTDSDGTYEKTGTTVSGISGGTTVKLRVTDDGGKIDTRTQTVSATNSPPSADFSYTASGGTYTLDASSSGDSDGSISSYEWDLDGDGAYEKTGTTVSGVTGGKTVELKVTDDDGATDTKSRSLPNQPPNADFSSSPDSGAYELDASSSSDPDGSITTYEWDLDDDGSYDDDTGTTVTGVQGGETVGLKVSDDDGASDTYSTTLPNDSPSADFDKTSTGSGYDLDASPSSDPDGSITTYEWDLDGDGTYEKTGSTVSGVSAGTTVTLEVTDNGGASATYSETLPAANSPPTADFNKNRKGGSGKASMDASPSSDPDGTIVSYKWDVGNDGSIDYTGKNPRNKKFSSQDVKLIVTDDDGATDSIVKTV